MTNRNTLTKRISALALALMILITASATRVEAVTAPALTTTTLTPEQIEAIVEEVYNGFATFDVQNVVSHFAADAVVEDPVGTPPMQGTQAITAHLQSFPTLFEQVRLYSLEVRVGGQEAAVKWRYRFKTKTGKTFFLDGFGHSTFNEQGKIQTLKEFFDLAYFLEQLQG
jgi:steroid Delta-isomerase